MTLRVSGKQSKNDLDSIRKSYDVCYWAKQGGATENSQCALHLLWYFFFGAGPCGAGCPIPFLTLRTRFNWSVTCCAYPACATFPKLGPRWWSSSPRLWSSCRRRWAGSHWRHNRCSLLPAVSQMLPLAGQACRRGLSLPHHACGAHKPQKLETRADET